MTKAIKIFGILFLLVIGQLSYGQTGEEEYVRNVFESYKASILNGKGEDAVKFVNSRTIKYYSDILELVKTADRAKIETLSILDKLMVFTLRHSAPKENILGFDGKALLIYAIKSGMIAKDSVSSTSIGEITISKDFAKGQFITNGQKTPLYFHFYKEDGQWKIDLTSLFPVSTMAIKQMAEASGQGENEYLFSLLDITTGKKPGAEIWQPMGQHTK